MQLPKYKKKKRIKLKVCQEPGCGGEFWGHPIAKYCDDHRDIKQRQKQKKDCKNKRIEEQTTLRKTAFWKQSLQTQK